MNNCIEIPAHISKSTVLIWMQSLRDNLLKQKEKPFYFVEFLEQQCKLDSLETGQLLAIFSLNFDKHCFRTMHDTCFHPYFFEYWHCSKTTIQEITCIIDDIIKELNNVSS